MNNPTFMDKIQRCEHCLAANKADDKVCNYCGYNLSPWSDRPRPRTLGEELTFQRFNGVIKRQ